MIRFRWIVGALGAAALAVPGAASAQDYDSEWGTGAGQQDGQFDGNGTTTDRDLDGDRALEGEVDQDGARLDQDGTYEEDVFIEQDGDGMRDGNGMYEDDVRIEQNGNGRYEEDVRIEQDGDRAQLQRETEVDQNGAWVAEDTWDVDENGRVEERDRNGNDRSARAQGLRVQANGGIISFPGEAAASLTPGGAYGVLVGIKPLPVVELELGYQGAAYQTDGNLTGAQENVIENGGQAVLKASPWVGGIEPYAFGGYQLSRFNVYERDQGTGAVQDSTVNKAPVGLGVDFHLGDVMLGARGQYNFVFQEDLFTDVDGNRSADQIAGTLTLGGRF